MAESQDSIIEVVDLTKFYDNFLAVDQINFEVRRGELFGFLGPNGAGKTTTIRMLTGLSRPSSGKASILGLDISQNLVEIKHYIGVVPEVSNLYDELSALDNLLFMARLYGVPGNQRKKRAEELLKIFGLDERKNSLFGTFSRGMKRALTIAAGLIHKPEILFLDEPTVGLDVVAARSLRNLISNLHQEGITVFLTTHYLEEADLLCDRVAILVKGRIIKIDSPQALKALAQEESIIEFSFGGEMPTFLKSLAARLPAVRIITADHNKVRVYGGVPASIYTEVCKLAEESHLEILAVNTIRPSLEDAFIKITGLSPAVMAMEKGAK